MVRSSLRLLVTICFLTAGSLIAEQHPVPPPAISQELFAPYWTAEPGWHTDLQLRNGLRSAPLVVTPVLRLSSGQEYSLTPVSIGPSDVVTVDVRPGAPGLAQFETWETYFGIPIQLLVRCRHMA
jgi:hypothetical protein